MKTGRYSLQELLSHNEIEQFVIPELQRDYVWSATQVNGLLESVMQRFDTKDASRLRIYDQDRLINDAGTIEYLSKEFNRLKYKLKLGFLYAYHDKEFPGRFFLIDGQQRITTLYLLLMALYVRAGLSTKFAEQYFVNGLPKVDYKVRESAHDFLLLFINDVLNQKDVVKNPNYFENEYKYDKTVNNLKNNFNLIVSYLSKKKELDNEQLIDYVENYVEFNYFDTNLSSQGEKLYLYMNSRGAKLSSQELLRAKLIEKIDKSEEKIKAGEKWEEWQDFFFRNKCDNENADLGFEHFLTLVTILKKQRDRVLTINDLGFLKADDDDMKKYQVMNLDIAFIEESFLALKRCLFEGMDNEIYREEYFTESRSKLNKLFRYLPCLYFQLFFQDQHVAISDADFDKFRLFILNQSHSSEVANKTTESIFKALNFVDQLIDPDLGKHLELVGKAYGDHEEHKLIWLTDPSINIELYNFLKITYFDYNLNEFLEGETRLLFHQAEQYDINGLFDFNLLGRIVSKLKLMFFTDIVDGIETSLSSSNRSSRLLRRYFLSYFDYVDNSKTSYGGIRYSLIVDGRFWLNRICFNSNFDKVMKDWLDDDITSLYESFNSRIDKMINTDWRYYFCIEEDLLNTCGSMSFAGKLSLNDVSNVILMKGVASSSSDRYLACTFFTSYCRRSGTIYQFEHYERSVCYIDLVKKDNRIIKSTSNNPNSLAIDLVYSRNKSWDISVFYRNSDIRSFNSDAGWFNFGIEEREVRFTKERFKFNYDDDLDLEINTSRFYKHVEGVIHELDKNGFIKEQMNKELSFTLTLN
ncbi:DUF262 domain-containing protein [Sphingobacterium sp. UBA6320]|uniref:DUF262 domain-containing protein n=1 Tax=Sphingobacterium sp. UBA6320 TaxID=1947510 RepID=UPI0025D53191|nr:DUF262 domain-containing protein [Sphingobacterium sp. UBA6320]